MNRQTDRVEFTREMKKRLYHFGAEHAAGAFGFLRKVFEEYGYNLKILQNDGQAVVDGFEVCT